MSYCKLDTDKVKCLCECVCDIGDVIYEQSASPILNNEMVWNEKVHVLLKHDLLWMSYCKLDTDKVKCLWECVCDIGDVIYEKSESHILKN